MSDRVSTVWKALLGEVPPKKSPQHGMYAAKLSLLNKLPADIVEGKQGACLPYDDLKAIMDPLRVKFPAQTYTFLVRFISRGLAKGKRTLHWQVTPPPVPINVLRDKARFTPAKFSHLQNLHSMEASFHRSVTSDVNLSPAENIGRLLFSAIVYGGLLQKNWLAPWVNALFTGRRTFHYNLWLDMERNWNRPNRRNEAGKQRSTEKLIVIRRRWFADPISQLLILCWLSLPPEMRPLSLTHTNLFAQIVSFLIKAGHPEKLLPHSLDAFLEMAETRLGLHVPPYLASYASGWLNSIFLPPETWIRLLSTKTIGRSQLLTEDCENAGEPQKLCSSDDRKVAAPNIQQKMLKRLRAIFHRKNLAKSHRSIRDDLKFFREDYGQELSPLLLYLTAWSSSYLQPRSNYSPTTPKRYLTAIGGILLSVIGNDEIVNCDAAEFMSYYDRALELVVTEREQGYARSTIGRFHDYLVRSHDVAKLQMGYFMHRSGPPETTVDANIVSQFEFDRLKIDLGSQCGNRSRTATAALLVAIFGFRCGLRRNEVFMLRVRDIQGRERPELLLRTHSQRRLKTDDATRRIPLFVLLQPEELDLLRLWLKQYRECHKDTLLFCFNNDWPKKPLRESSIFTPIRNALHRVTGDNSLVFHHLRHSFGNWLLLRLTGNASDLHKAAPFLDHPEFAATRIDELRKSLLGNEQLGRKAAYAVATLLGHAGLETTFTSYIHLCDWLLGRELSRDRSLPTVSPLFIEKATGLCRARVYDIIASVPCKHETSSQITNFFGHYRKQLAADRDQHFLLVKEPPEPQLEFASDLHDEHVCFIAHRALSLHQRKRFDSATIGDLISFPQAIVEQWLSRAQYIANLKGDARYDNAVPTLRHMNISPTRLIDLTTKHYRERRHMRWHHLSSMQIPIRENEREELKELINAFARLYPKTTIKILDQADYFIHRFSMRTGMLVFHEPSKAKRFIEAALWLGIKRQNIGLVEFETKGLNKAQMLARRSEWEEELNFRGGTWLKGNKKWGRTAGIGNVGVKVLSSAEPRPQSSYAFRYFLYLVDITFSCDLFKYVFTCLFTHRPGRSGYLTQPYVITRNIALSQTPPYRSCP